MRPTEAAQGEVSVDVPVQTAERTSSVLGLVSALFVSLWRFGRWRIVWLVVLTLALTVTAGVSLVLLVPLLGVAGVDVGDGAVQSISLLAQDQLRSVGLELSLPVVVLAYIVVVGISAFVQRRHVLASASLQQGYLVDLRDRLYAAIMRAEWSFLVRRKSADFTHQMTDEVSRVGAAAMTLLSLIANVLIAAVHVAVALLVSPAASLLVLACGASLVLVLSPKTRAGRVKGEAISRSFEALFGVVGEHLAGLRLIKSYGVGSRSFDRFHARSSMTADAVVDSQRNHADVVFWMKLGSAIIMGGVFYVAMELLGLALASILLLLYVFARLVPMIQSLQSQVHQLLTFLPAYARLEAAIASCASHAELDGPGTAKREFTGHVRLERVSFAHDGGVEVVRDVDLEIPAGKTSAIVGPSGAGKSTLTDLVVGLLRPTRGRVTVDGDPLEGSLLAAWRRSIGYVHQDTFMFHETVRDNLLLVRPEATDDELRAALEAAAASFVLGLPDGLDTVLGDRGVRLSGGERQRVALARAFLRRPALLVLDEATSALDSQNELLIQEAIEHVVGRQTMLVVTHRLSTVRGADVLHVMDDGRIVESGSWDALVHLPGGRFRSLCTAQGLDVPPLEHPTRA